MTPSQLQEWKEISDEADKCIDGSMRLCAICYCAVDRQDHADHMRAHGYDILDIAESAVIDGY